MKYQHVIWDWNGTLLDDVSCSLAAINALCHKRGLPAQSLEAYRRHFAFPVIGYYRHIGFDLDKEDFSALSAEFMEAYESKRATDAKPFPDAGGLLEAIAEKAIPQHILSAYRQDALSRAVETYGLKRFFETVQGHHDNTAGCKIANANRLFGKAGIEAAKCLIIGDTLHDAEVARATGADCFLIATGYQSRERLEESGLPVFTDHRQLKTHLLPHHFTLPNPTKS